MYLYLKINVKWGIQNTKLQIINQHKNGMCHVQSLENDFYLNALAPLTMISHKMMSLFVFPIIITFLDMFAH